MSETFDLIISQEKKSYAHNQQKSLSCLIAHREINLFNTHGGSCFTSYRGGSVDIHVGTRRRFWGFSRFALSISNQRSPLCSYHIDGCSHRAHMSHQIFCCESTCRSKLRRNSELVWLETVQRTLFAQIYSNGK